MTRNLSITAVLLVVLTTSCSISTKPEGIYYPLEGIIEGRVTYVSDDLAYSIYKPGLNLHLVSRHIYDAGCYQFWTTKDLGALTLHINVRGVYRPSPGACTGEMCPASSTINLGNPGDGAYCLQLADSDKVYVGLLHVSGDQVTVTFPDTTRFNFLTSIFP